MATHFVKKLSKPVKVFKVVRKLPDGQYLSPGAYDYVGITYILNEEVQPFVEKTPIFCFEDVNSAFAYATGHNHVVLECSTDKLYGVQNQRIIPMSKMHTIKPEILYDFWSVPLDRKRFRNFDTVLCAFNNILVASLTPLREFSFVEHASQGVLA